MGVPDNTLNDLERQRLELEDNIAKLQRSLYHWRTWEAEYDGLKEEISDLDDQATGEDILRVGHNFEGTLVNDDEVRVIIGEKQGVARSKQQVVDMILRRIDYVKTNISTMEKRLRAKENQLYALDAAEQLPEEPAADFPMTEIVEELDENGQVISSSTTTPGDQASDLLEVLRKAGVQDIPETSKRIAQTTKDEKAQDRSVGSEEIPSSTHLEDTAPNAQPEAQAEVPVLDVDEPPEDAKLRREMLQYGLNEVGAVVAELELDENASDISIDEYDSYEEDEDEDEEDEFGRSIRPVLDEDYHQKMRELEAKLNARGMLNVGKDTGSLPKNVKEDLDQPQTVQTQSSSDLKEKSTREDAKPKKRVAFADELDIAPAPNLTAPERKLAASKQPDVPVLSDAVIERTKSVESTPSKTDASKKVSRFKIARNTMGSQVGGDLSTSSSNSRSPDIRRPVLSSPSPSLPLIPAKPAKPKPFSQPISDHIEIPGAPNPPKDKILADALVERDTSKEAAMAPEPDELDEQLHKKQIASEFYRMRNRMIQQKGGFLDEEQEIVPVETEEAPKRVSKFRAARMR